ncbi:MAG: aromatic-ring-hydroxylating dioxygenase subunit beta, partial [Candidatus Eremiobacteraeota bacterium]|nr:aromatic-ring-hydroxylating dioxygenase subunit beta [Candidatus Eremiobacteraeota bacterium]
MNATAPISIEDRLRIDDLYAAYAACLDDARFAEWPDFFTDDCTYRIVPRENYDRGLPLATLSFESKGMLRDRVYAVTETLFHEPYYQRHIVSGLLVRADDDGGYRVQANYVVIRTKKGALSEIYNAGRYVDRIVDDGGALRFREKLCVFDSELIPNSLIY